MDYRYPHNQSILLGIQDQIYKSLLSRYIPLLGKPMVATWYDKNFENRGSDFMTLEIIIILLTIVLAVYFLFRPTSKKEKERFEDKDNWRGGF